MRAWCVLVALMAGCAGDPAADERGAAREDLRDPTRAEPEPEPAPAAVETERGPTRASVEREMADEPTPAPARPMRRRVDVAELQVVPVDVAEGEDGHGAVAPAAEPVALDLVSPDGFPGRARDPVLYVGPLHFRRYSHPGPDRMRFVVADRAALPAGAEVALQWGDDVASRVVVTPSLEVPR